MLLSSILFRSEDDMNLRDLVGSVEVVKPWGDKFVVTGPTRKISPILTTAGCEIIKQAIKEKKLVLRDIVENGQKVGEGYMLRVLA